MPTPRSLKNYPAVYWSYALQVLDARESAELPEEFRFPVPGAIKGVTGATVMSQMRRLLQASDNFEHARIGEALEAYSIRHEGREIVLKRKARDGGVQLDSAMLARVNAVRSGLGSDSLLRRGGKEAQRFTEEEMSQGLDPETLMKRFLNQG
jgi:hypothetical protein